MAAYYSSNTWQSDIDIERKRYERIYNISRHAITVIMVFIMINIVIKLCYQGDYFLFSAYIPYMFIEYGMLYSGVYPAGYDPGGLAAMAKYDATFFGIMMFVSMLIVIVYIRCLSNSKNNKVGWMITALVMFSVDTLSYFISNGVGIDGIIDIVFRTVILVGLISGVIAHYRLKELPVKSLHRE